ncbi:MAG: hypothetical protein ACFE95_01960, partial [Candidatus Hodarchaeota archaeon]
FCMKCGSRYPDVILPPTDQIEQELEKPPVQVPISESEEDKEEEEEEETEPEIILEQPIGIVEQGLNYLRLLRERFSTILVLLGALAIIVAISFSLLVLLPEELISDIEIPPIEGMVFDIFVIVGLIAIISKEGTVFLGYIPKKETLDRWFSFVLILIFWVNLVTFSLGLVETSIFLVIELSFQLIFIFLSIILLLLSFMYFGRFKEPIFSMALSIALMSVLYLIQWIVPIEPLWFTILIYISIAFLLVIARFDKVPFIGGKLLMPIMFLSPYLLSNSSVIAILALMVSFPFIEIFLSRYLLREKFAKNLAIQSIGEISSLLGLITVSFSVFYGYIDVVIAFFLLAIPVLGLISLKTIQPTLRINPGRDLALIVYLAFITAFFDIIINDLLVLTGISFLLVFQSSFTFFEYRDILQNHYREYTAILLLISLIIISLSKIDFFLKNCLIIVPLAVLLVLIIRKKAIDTKIVQSVVFGTEILILLSFVRTPLIDWLIIPVFGVLVIIGVSTLILFNKTSTKAKYSFDLLIFTILFETVLLGITLGMRNREEMLIPVFILIMLAGIISVMQVFRPISYEFLWLNASFVVCFGIMTFWNEFDTHWIVLTSTILVLPILLEIPLMKGIQKPEAIETFTKNFNLNFSFSAISLFLITFFEELDPFSHSLLFLIITVTWVLLYLLGKQSNLGICAILVFPGMIFIFELLLNQSLFTPISETTYYLYPILLVMIFPAIVFQMEYFLRKREFERITVTPFVIGTSILALVLAVAFMIYNFDPNEYLVLILGFIFMLLVSTFLIKWQYESIILIIISSFPPIFYLNYLELSPFIFYLLPILPILVNFLIGMRYFKTSLSIKLHELLLLIYIILFIFLDPTQIYEFSTALATLFLISWQFLAGMKQQVDQEAFILTNLFNSALIAVIIFFIDPLAPDTSLTYGGMTISLTTISIGIILLLVTLTMILQLINWQFSNIISKLTPLMIINLIFNSSSMILSSILILTRISNLNIESMALGILLGSTVLLLLSIFLYTKISFIKSQIMVACVCTASIWILISSLYFSNMELFFLWILIAPLLMIVYITKQERSIAAIGIAIYFVAGIRLIDNTLDFIVLGTTDWLTILGLILFGIELVTLGIYASLAKKSMNHRQPLENT